jgi:hypothetical protein
MTIGIVGVACCAGRSEQLARFVSLALLLPQAAQTHRGPQLQRFGLLVASNVEGLTKTGLRICLDVRRGALTARLKH